MDIVFIKELCIETVIGVYDWEKNKAICVYRPRAGNRYK